MKIEGWDKINGFAYKGYVITNANFDFQANQYYADVINLNDSNCLGWLLTLSPTNDVALLKITDNNTAPKSTVTQKGVTKDTFSTLKMFRIHFEGLVDEMILLTTTHTSNVVGGTFVTHSYAPYVPMTITPVTGLNGSTGNNLW